MPTLANATIDAETWLENPGLPHIIMRLEDFCNGTRDNKRVQCLLDMPTLDRKRPDFVK